MVGGTTLVLGLLVFRFLVEIPVVYTFCNLFVMQEYVFVLVASALETDLWLICCWGQGCRYHRLRGAFSGFYYPHSGLVVRCGVCLGAFLRRGVFVGRNGYGPKWLFAEVTRNLEILVLFPPYFIKAI